MHEEITLAREVEAIQIPSGDAITLPAGTLRGHTFHYSRCESTVQVERHTESVRGGALGVGEAVYRAGSLRASYFHAWFPSSPAAAASLFLPGDLT